MKRIGKQDVIKMLQKGYVIRYYDWYMLYAGYKVVCDDNVIGYITANTFQNIMPMLYQSSQYYGYVEYKNI